MNRPHLSGGLLRVWAAGAASAMALVAGTPDLLTSRIDVGSTVAAQSDEQIPPCQCSYRLIKSGTSTWCDVTATEGALQATPKCNDAQGCTELVNCDADPGTAIVRVTNWSVVPANQPVKVYLNGEYRGKLAYNSPGALSVAVGGDPVACSASGATEDGGDTILVCRPDPENPANQICSEFTIKDDCSACRGEN